MKTDELAWPSLMGWFAIYAGYLYALLVPGFEQAQAIFGVSVIAGAIFLLLIMLLPFFLNEESVSMQKPKED